MNEETIFAEASAIESPVERSKFLDEACAGNADLRTAVDRLLQLHESAGSFLEKPPVEATDTATILHVHGSTHDDDAVSPPQQAVRDLEDEEIPLGYLQPASQPNSLGRLGHYEILDVVGRGAFGTVLRAFDERLQRVVAIKVLAPEMAATSPARKRFLREARTSAAIRHENVVAIHAVEDEPIPYIVMEYIPGQTLQQRLDEHGPLDLQDVLRLGKQIAGGLAAAHAQGLIHRDIKPGNILLEGGVMERVKITDFGLARTADDASLTQSGLIAGTPMYMAPEQALGQKLDQRADLFSLGSVLYQMLSGRPPFRAANTVAVLKRVVEDTPRPIPEILPEVPEWVCQLIGHLHAKNPDDRYQTALEVADRLARCLDNLKAGHEPKIPSPKQSTAPEDNTTSEAERVTPNKTRLSRKRPWAAVAAAALLLVFGLTITEATGVTQLTSTVIRLSTGSGTLVIETDDPGIKIAINGEEVTIRGGGVEELTLRPGKYKVAATKDGQPVKQELVSITRNGRTVVRLEPSETVATEGLASGQPIDLIGLLDPARDFLDSRLKLQDGKLITPPFNSVPGAIGMIPYGPVPAEYDIELQLQRLSHRIAGFNMGLLIGGRQVAVGMDCGGKERAWGLDFLDTFSGPDPRNPTRNPGNRLPVGKTCDVTIQVRNNHITASCDGETLIDWTGAPERLSLWKEVKLPRSDALFFWAQADFVVHKMTLIPRGAAAGPKESKRPIEWSADAPPPAIPPFDPDQAKAHRVAWAKSLGVPEEKEILLGRNRRGQDVTLSLVLIPPGEFLMGSSEEEIKTLREQAAASGLEVKDLGMINLEGPRRLVRITRPFYLGRHEVSTDQFRSFVQAQPAGYQTEPEASGLGAFGPDAPGKDPRYTWKQAGKKNPQAPGKPVVNVTWNDANDFCQWLSQLDSGLTFVLPTEAQWEYACRAGTTTLWFTGDEESSLENYAVINTSWPQEGDRLPNAFGLCDMHGNVWEWCQDAFYDYRNAGTVDPIGAVNGEFRVIRGGSCFGGFKKGWMERSGCRSAVRFVRRPDNPLLQVGFRVAAAIPEDVIQAAVSRNKDASQPGADPDEQSRSTEGWIELLPLIDPQQDVVKGNWSGEAGELVIAESKKQHSVIEIPYEPPTEYDVLIEFTRLSGKTDISVNLSRGQEVFGFNFAQSNENFGISRINGGNQWSKRPDLALKNGRRYIGRIEVRQDRITGYLGEELVFSAVTTGSELTRFEGVRQPHDLQLGLSVWEVAAHFHRVAVKEITGKGVFPRGEPRTVGADWSSLFNGKDLTGWKTLSELPGQWEVKDGVLTGSSKPSYLFSERGDLANFHLRAEMKVNGLGDCGLWFRAPYAFRHGPQAWMTQPATGYETELRDQPHPMGTVWQIFGETPPQVLAPAVQTPDHPVGEWFTLEVVAESNHLITKVNGHEAVNTRDRFNRFRVGHLVLAVTHPQTVLEVRRIEVRELPATSAPPPPVHQFASGEWIDVIPLIDPKLDKWDMRQTGTNDWRIEEGELVVGADEKPSKLLLPLDADLWPSFECELVVTRRSGDAGFNLNVPAGAGDSPLGFDRPSKPGVNLFLRQWAPVSLTDAPQFETGKQVTLRIEVRGTADGDRITVWNDDAQVGAWTGDRNELGSVNNEGYPHNRRLSLWVPGGSEFVFHSILVRTLDGTTAGALRPVPADTAVPPPTEATN